MLTEVLFLKGISEVSYGCLGEGVFHYLLEQQEIILLLRVVICFTKKVVWQEMLVTVEGDKKDLEKKDVDSVSGQVSP